MRMPELSGPYRRDFKKFEYDRELEGALDNLIVLLVHDRPLPISARDHALQGAWSGYRECHIRPDLLLIYQKRDSEFLMIARIGSHSELFG